MPDIKDQKLLYHLTSAKNIGSILTEGLKPRAQLSRFDDVADQEIIAKRRALALENYVPFHWFARNPFDGAVQATRPTEQFVLITVRRTLAARQNWKVIPRHPLATGEIELMDYAEGVAAIDWSVMNRRDYHDPHCKSVCMAECLSPNPILLDSFFKIYAPSDKIANYVSGKINALGRLVEVVVNEHMFLR